MYALYVLCRTLGLLCSVVSLAMCLRTLLSFFDQTEEGRLLGFVALITEPFAAPFRALCDRLGLGEDLPFDVGFFVALLFYAACSVFLPQLPLPV